MIGYLFGYFKLTVSNNDSNLKVHYIVRKKIIVIFANNNNSNNDSTVEQTEQLKLNNINKNWKKSQYVSGKWSVKWLVNVYMTMTIVVVIIVVILVVSINLASEREINTFTRLWWSRWERSLREREKRKKFDQLQTNKRTHTPFEA